MNSPDMRNLPEKKFRAGPITATIWFNQGPAKDGSIVSYRTVTLDRSYRDKNNNWQNTGSFRANDLPRAALVLNKAFEYLMLSGNIPGAE